MFLNSAPLMSLLRMHCGCSGEQSLIAACAGGAGRSAGRLLSTRNSVFHASGLNFPGTPTNKSPLINPMKEWNQ